MRASITAAATDRLRRQLAASPDGRVSVVHRGPHAVYADLGDRLESATGVETPCLVGVLASRSAALPVGLRLARADLGGLADAAVSVRGGVLHLDETPVRITRIVAAGVPRMPEPRSVSEVPRGPIRRLLDTMPDVAAGTVADLVGAGPGLTPLGDDVLCGWLAWHRAAGITTTTVDAVVRRAWSQTTRLSAALLAEALAGEVVPQFAALIRSLGTPREAVAATALLRLGATSGAGMLYGAWSASRDHRAVAAA